MYLSDVYTVSANLAGLPGALDSLRRDRRAAGGAAADRGARSTRRHLLRVADAYQRTHRPPPAAPAGAA